MARSQTLGVASAGRRQGKMGYSRREGRHSFSASQNARRPYLMSEVRANFAISAHASRSGSGRQLDPVPSMLLPSKRKQVRFIPEVVLQLSRRSSGRRPTVQPIDLDTSLELVVSVRDRATTSPETTFSSDHYLDTFADVIKEPLRRKTPSSVEQVRSKSPSLYDTDCPECRRMMEVDSHLVLDWVDLLRTNYQALPKHNNVLRGNRPHFCNFVKHKKLHERTSLVPDGSHERRRTLTEAQQCHYRRQDRLNSVTSGRQARPSSPVDEKQNATESHEDNDVIRVNIRRKKGKFRRKKTRRRVGGGSEDENGECHDEEVERNCVCHPEETFTVAANTKHDEPEDDADQTLAPPGEDPVQVEESETSKNADSSSSLASSRVRHKRERRPKKQKKSPESKEKDELAVPEPEEKPEEVEVKAEEAVKEPTPPSTPVVSTIPAYVPLRKESEKRPTPKPKAETTKTLAVTDFSKYIVDISPKADNISPKQEFYSFATNTMSHGEYTQQKSVSNPWSQGRLALSQQSSRFELPMDMKVLETMTPMEYLSKYCVVTSKRQWLYEKIYLKHKEPKLGGLNIKGLDKALKEALVDTVTSDDVKEIIELVGLNESSKIDQKLFTGIAAMTERLLYPKFLTDDTQNIKDHKKEKIECADFCALDWKLHGVNVNPDMKKLLESL